jgi:Ca2+-binding EF-hand superfamily protein
VQPTYIPLKTLDELKIYTDFLKKIANEFHSIEEAFMAIDIHREGYITPDELRSVLDNFAFKMSPHQFEALLGVFDQNHDGKISYNEFMQQVKFMDDTEMEEQALADQQKMLEFDQSPEAQKRLQQMKNRTAKKTSYEFLMEKIWEKSDSIHSAFKQMDTDRSGSLSANELKVRAKALMLLEGRPPQLC